MYVPHHNHHLTLEPESIGDDNYNIFGSFICINLETSCLPIQYMFRLYLPTYSSSLIESCDLTSDSDLFCGNSQI